MPARSPLSGTRTGVLPDPAAQSVDTVRPIRNDIEERVRRLLTDLGITPSADRSSGGATPTAR